MTSYGFREDERSINDFIELGMQAQSTWFICAYIEDDGTLMIRYMPTNLLPELRIKKQFQLVGIWHGQYRTDGFAIPVEALYSKLKCPLCSDGIITPLNRKNRNIHQCISCGEYICKQCNGRGVIGKYAVVYCPKCNTPSK
jgi:hypothetical protein